VCADFAIRKAAAKDARAIALIQVGASRAAYGAAVPPGYFDRLSESNRMSAWSEMIANQSDFEQIIVGEENSHIRGYAHFGRSRDPGVPPNVGELYSLYVDPLHWQRGLGRQLLAASLRGLASMTFDTATLWVLAANRPARGFYERFGWTANRSEKAVHGNIVEIRYRISTRQWAGSGDHKNHLRFST
jgi:ribosomal protein S18 acetylase RimI-like enzyme